MYTSQITIKWMSKNTTSIKAKKHIYWKEQFTKERESPDKSKNHKRQRPGGDKSVVL